MTRCDGENFLNFLLQIKKNIKRVSMSDSGLLNGYTRLLVSRLLDTLVSCCFLLLLLLLMLLLLLLLLLLVK